MRRRLLDADRLVSAVAAGRRRGAAPACRRAEVRYVDLKAGRRLQVTTYDDTQAHTANHDAEAAAAAVDALLGKPFGNWHVETTAEVLQLRVTKKGAASVHLRAREGAPPERGHDRDKARLVAEDDPLLLALGIATPEGRVKPSRRDKYHQVEELVRLLDATVSEALAKGHLRTPTPAEPLAGRRPRVRQRLPHLRGAPPASRAARAAGQPGRGRHQGTVATPQRRGRRPVRAGGVRGALRRGPDRRGRARPGARGGPGAARVRHRHRRRAGPRPRLAGLGGAGRALLPPRHRGPAAAAPRGRARLPADPRRHPARAVRRHAHRRAAVGAAARRGLSRRRGGVRRQRAHPAQHAAPRRAHRRPVSDGTGGVRRPRRGLGGPPEARRLVGGEG